MADAPYVFGQPVNTSTGRTDRNHAYRLCEEFDEFHHGGRATMPKAGRQGPGSDQYEALWRATLTLYPHPQLWASGSRCRASWRVLVAMPPVARHNASYREAAVHGRDGGLD